jgi:class 3 adenylate cyclase
MFEQGFSAGDIGARAGDISPRLSAASDDALGAIYHAQQQITWTTNIVSGIRVALAQAGLSPAEERSPAMGFLDLTGFTSLTQERGDAAAASLVERLNRTVQRIAVEHGGRPVKWLGDGVMCHFPDPTGGVIASLEMVEILPRSGLPPAHVGLHAGPVIRQEGDFYGQTVNLAARIGEYARPGEVLVSEAVVAAASDERLGYRSVGQVGLKGVSGVVELYVAQRQT